MIVEPGAGPAHAPASASAGLFTDAPLRYSGRGRLPLGPAGGGSELRYAVFPVYDGGFGATAVAVDVVFDDGTRLLDGPAVDQYGLPADAAGSLAAHALMPDQWNLRRIDLGGRRAVALEGVSETDGEGWLDGVVVGDPRPLPRVDTRRGSHSSPSLSRGNTAPFVAVPHGAVFATPMTDLSNPHWNYTWNAHGPGRLPSLAGLAISHSASIWIGDWGALAVIPDGDGTFDHDDEVALPHVYSVTRLDGVRAEATADDWGVVMRFTGAGSLELNTFGPASFELRDGILTGWIDGSSVHGHVIPRVYVRAATTGVTRLDGTTLTVEAEATLRIGTSLISVENAPVPGPFDEVRDAAEQRWERIFSTVRVEGATDDERLTLYSNLYRMFLYPSRLGERMPDGTLAHFSPARGEVVPGALSANNGFWDTSRTIWPALVLLQPDTAAELLDGFVQHYREGGWVPRWSAPGSLDAMVGTSFDIVFADAASKGVVDPEVGWRAALRDATAVPPHPADGRKGLGSSLYRGYADRTTPEGLSWTMEGALNDYGLSVLAEMLGHAAERRYFASRALAHETLLDPATGFFRGRSAAGEFEEPFDPFAWGGDYTETSAWTTAFAAPHAAARLRDLGPRLDEYFATPEPGDESVRGEYPTVIHEMVEARDLRMGLWGLSNQPAHHIPFLYAHAGRPADLQRIVAEARQRLFTGSEIGQGYPGDEDNGEMSAWWFWTALGLYPLTPGSGEYVVVGPLFERMTVDLPGGTLDVVAHGSGPYVQSLLLDGSPWDSVALPHARIAGGARLDFFLGGSPGAWGADTRPFSHQAPRLVDASSGGGTLSDDRGDTVVDVEEVTLAADGTPVMYTLTFADPGTHTWRLEADGAVIDERTETTEWPRQLRPFEIAVPRAAREFRLVGALRLTQVELLVELAE